MSTIFSAAFTTGPQFWSNQTTTCSMFSSMMARVPPQVNVTKPAAAEPLFDDYGAAFDHKKLMLDCLNRREQERTASIEEARSMESFNLDDALDEKRFVHLKASSRLAPVDSKSSSQSSSLECLSADEGYVGSYPSDRQCSMLVKRSSGSRRQNDLAKPPTVVPEPTKPVNAPLILDELQQLLSFLTAEPDDHVVIPALFESGQPEPAFVNLLDLSNELDRLLAEPEWPQPLPEATESVWSWCQDDWPVQTGQKTSEFRYEDLIDTNAYLNEIEMNMDYFQSEVEALYHQNADSSYWQSDPVTMDTMLTYKSNRDAFNLREWHRTFVREASPKPEAVETKAAKGTFANIQVDSIAEFIPPAPKYQQPEAENEAESEHEHEQADEAAYYDEETVKFVCSDETGAYYEHAVAETGEDEAQAYEAYEAAEMAYYGGGGELDDGEYDFQLLVDQMTEKDALEMLASQSELYALQMAQAAKLGISLDLTSDGDFGEQTAAVAGGGGQTALEASSSGDSFENIFSYDEQLTDWPKESAAKESISSKSSSAWSSLASEQAESNSNLCCQESDPYGASTITNSTVASVSLRTSLLKLLQTQHQLARLLKQKQESCKLGPLSATSNSSTSSSLTTSSVFLNKQAMNNYQSSSKKPCVYKLNDGHCSRADCRFAHDFKSITCKYWLEGECLKGEACEFLHEIVEPSAPSRSGNRRGSLSSNSSTIFGKKSGKKTAKQPDFKLDSEEFPALGGGPPQVVIVSVETQEPAPKPVETRKPMTLAAKLKSGMDKKAKAAKPKDQCCKSTGTLTASNKLNQIAAPSAKPDEDGVKKAAAALSAESKNENKPCEKKSVESGQRPVSTPKKASNITIVNYGIDAKAKKPAGKANKKR